MTSLFRVVLVMISLLILVSFSVSAVAFVLMSLAQLSEFLNHASRFHQSSLIFLTDILQLPISAGFSAVFTHARPFFFFFFHVSCLRDSSQTVSSYRFLESSVM